MSLAPIEVPVPTTTGAMPGPWRRFLAAIGGRRQLRRALLGAQMGPLYWEHREGDAGPTPSPEAEVPPLQEN